MSSTTSSLSTLVDDSMLDQIKTALVDLKNRSGSSLKHIVQQLISNSTVWEVADCIPTYRGPMNDSSINWEKCIVVSNMTKRITSWDLQIISDGQRINNVPRQFIRQSTTLMTDLTDFSPYVTAALCKGVKNGSFVSFSGKWKLTTGSAAAAPTKKIATPRSSRALRGLADTLTSGRKDAAPSALGRLATSKRATRTRTRTTTTKVPKIMVQKVVVSASAKATEATKAT
jgi:hypothetical protein